jgi:hypothetical protein
MGRSGPRQRYPYSKSPGETPELCRFNSGLAAWIVTPAPTYRTVDRGRGPVLLEFSP